MPSEQCRRCGHLILDPASPCQVCQVLDAETASLSPEQRQQRFARERDQAENSAVPTQAAPVQGLAPTEPTYYLQELAEQPGCPRCAGQLQTDGTCFGCEFRDQTATEEGWTSERIEEELTAEREFNVSFRAKEKVEVAGKSDQQITAEREQRKAATEREKAAKDAHRASIEPVIPSPACLEDLSRTQEDYTEQEQLEVERWAAARQFALPNGVPELTAISPHVLCSFVAEGKTEAGYVLAWSGRALTLGIATAAEPSWIGWYPFQSVSSITIQGDDSAQRRVTKPRAAAFGLFSLAAKKEYKYSYLLIENYDKPSLLLQVDGLLPVELQAQLSPLLNWYEQQHEQLAELYKLWHPPRLTAV